MANFLSNVSDKSPTESINTDHSVKSRRRLGRMAFSGTTNAENGAERDSYD